MKRSFRKLILFLITFLVLLSPSNLNIPIALADQVAPEKQLTNDFVIRSGSMPFESTGIYASQTKSVVIPANEVTNATAYYYDSGTLTLKRQNNQVTIEAKDGKPTSFKEDSTTLTDNGNTVANGTASKLIPGLYDVVSKTTTNGTVETSVNGDTLGVSWTGGTSHQVRVPPYTETKTEVTYQNFSNYAWSITWSTSPAGKGEDGQDKYYTWATTYDYWYDSNCNLQSKSTSFGQTLNYDQGSGSRGNGNITCSRPTYTSKEVPVYNYENRWDYSATVNYRTATYTYNTIINYDYKDFQPAAPTLVAPQDLSDGGIISFSKPTDDYTSENGLLMSLEWQQEGGSDWNPIFTDKTITDSLFSIQGSIIQYRWDAAGVDGMIKLRLSTKDGHNQPVYSYMNNDPDFLFRMSHKPVITPIGPSGGEQTNTVTPTYKWNYSQDEGEDQKGFYLQVRKVGASTLLYDSALIEQATSQFVQPSSNPLDWGSVHEWRIRPISNTGVLGDWSNWYAFGANEIPQLDSVEATSPTSIHVKTKPTSDTTGYKFYRGGQEFSDIPGLEVEDTNLPTNTEQTYNVRSYNAIAESPLSPSKTAYSLAASPEIESIETTTTSIILKVKPVNPNYTNHEIEYRKKGDVAWLPFANSASSNYLYIMNGLDKDTHFEMRLRAFNGRPSQNGIATDYVTAEAITKVDVPINGVFSNVTENSFTVTVDPNNNAASTKYRFWVDGVTDKTEYSKDLSFTFKDLPQGNRTYTVVAQAQGKNSESDPIPVGTVTTKAYPIKAEDVTLVAIDGKIKGSFNVGKNTPETQYEISDSATGTVLPYSDANVNFELPAPLANDKHTITILARDQLNNVTEPVSKDVYSLSKPVIDVSMNVASPNEVFLSFDMNGNPMVTEVLVKSVQGDSYDSGWVAGNNSHQMYYLTANTKQQYEIKTRNADGVESAAVLSPELYTLANRVTTARYDAGYDNIKVTLLADNPVGTLYKITNKTTGNVRDWSPDLTWDNSPLANETLNEYEVVAKNGDGIETVVVDIGSAETRKALGEYEKDPENPAPSEFNPDDRDGKTIELDGLGNNKAMLVKGQKLPLKLSQLINVVEWRYSINDGAWSEWSTVQNNEIKKDFHVDSPGLYKVTINFKNQFGKDAGSYVYFYLADWIAPNLSLVYDKVSKNSAAAIDMTYSDNLTYDLWYQTDTGSWKKLDITQLSKSLPQDNKFKKGNVRVSDIVGNVVDVPYEILSLNAEYVTFNEQSNGYDAHFNVEHKAGQMYHVATENKKANINKVLEEEKTPVKVTKLTESTKYDVRIGIKLPGEPLWIDQDAYTVTTLAIPDTTPPTITSISYKLKENEKAATLFITMEDNQGIDHVLINGKPYPVKFEGYYYKADIDVPLVEGANRFVVVAVDVGGNKTEQTQDIAYQLVVSELTVSPENLEVILGEQEQLKATVHFENGQSWEVTEEAEWSASGAVSVQSGKVTSDTIGTETVTATYEGKNGSASVHIIEQPGSVTSITVQAAAKMEEGSKQTLRAFATYATGKKRDVTNNTKWTVDDESVASISGNRLTALETGEVTVTATYSKQAGTAQITVVEAEEDPDKDRDKNHDKDKNTGGSKPMPNPSPGGTTSKPSDNLEDVIGGEKTTETITFPANSCGNMSLPDVEIDGGNMSVIGVSPCKSVKVLRAADNSVIEDVVKVVAVDYTVYDKSVGLNINLLADDGQAVKVVGDIPMLARYQLPQGADPKEWGLYKLDQTAMVWRLIPTFIASVDTIETRIDGEGYYKPMKLAKVSSNSWAKDAVEKMHNMKGMKPEATKDMKGAISVNEALEMFRGFTNERQFTRVQEAAQNLRLQKDTLTRQELVALANRAIETDMAALEAPLNGDLSKLGSFVDGKDVQQQYQSDLAIASNHNLLVGKSGNRLAPTDNVTREEAVTFLIRYAYFSGNVKYQSVRDLQ